MGRQRVLEALISLPNLVSPDTGLELGSGNAAGGAWTVEQSLDLLCFAQYSCVYHFPTGTLGILIRNLEMKQKLIIIALCSAIISPCAVYAASTSLDEVVVTATRLPQSLKQTIAHTTVFDEQAIRQSGVSDVPSLLRSLAGLEVAQSGGLGRQSSIFMRGTESDHVLVLLDGMRVNSATTGTTALEHIMLDSIERIEVVRGNVSSLYGSEAIGGVIQLFTKKGSGGTPTFSVKVGAGSHAARRLAAGFSGGVNDTSFSVNVGKVKTDGVSATNPLLAASANPDNDGYDNTTFNGQLSYVLNADHMVTATVFSSRGDVSFDSAFDAPADLHRSDSNIDKLSLTLDSQLSEVWDSQLRVAQGTDEIVSFKNNVRSSRFKTKSDQLIWQNNFQVSETQQLTLAVEHLAQTVSSTTVFTQNKRKVNSLLAGYVGTYGEHQVQANVRHDRYSDLGTANTALLGYGWQFSGKWRATASVSNAFHAPTFNELFWPGFSNPNLKPERSRNKEVGLHYAANGQRIDATYFDNRISDLIAGFPSKNINLARIDGVELNYAGTFDKTRVNASLTFQNPLDVTNGTVLRKRAKEFSAVSASHDFGVWRAGAELRSSGARQDGTNTLGGYQLLSLNANCKVNQDLELLVRVDNLFDRDYAEVYSYNTLGRTLYLELRHQM